MINILSNDGIEIDEDNIKSSDAGIILKDNNHKDIKT